MMSNEFLFFINLILIFSGYFLGTIYNWQDIKFPITFLFILTTGVYFIKNYIFIKKNEFQLIKKIIFFTIFIPKYYIGMLIILLSKGIKKEKRILYCLIINIFFYLVTIFLYKIEILKKNEGTREIGSEIIKRMSLGFGHPNTAMLVLMLILFLLYYSFYKRHKVKVLLLILILQQLIYKFTNSRTGYILIYLFILLIIIKDKYIIKLKKIIYLEMVFILFFSFKLPEILKNTKYNEILSWRFWLFDYYLNNQEITFWGTKTVVKFYTVLPLDNIYIRILLEYGIIGLLVFIISIIYIINLLYKNRDTKGIRILIILIFLGGLENVAFNYHINIIYLVVYEYLLESKNRN